MFQAFEGDGPEPIGFLLVPRFSMMAVASAIEPLRVANRLAGRTLFSWHLYSPDGAPVPASNGLPIVVAATIDAFAGLPTLVVCPSFDPQLFETKALLASLRRIARSGVTMVAVDTGAHFLARAGLLDGLRVTMHWEAVPGFREEFPGIEVSEELYEISGRVVTCAGGTAALDMMLEMIRVKHGEALAVAVSEQFIHDRIRERSSAQRMALESRLGTGNARVVKAVAMMEAALERPVATQALAARLGVTSRQLERLFRSHLGATPGHHYLGLRLARARQFLQQTEMTMAEIAVATGFSSASSLSRAYRGHYGVAPRSDRRPMPVRAADAAPIDGARTPRLPAEHLGGDRLREPAPQPVAAARAAPRRT
jgi:AraC family carnitine catabolism transcriptional activator